jgi:hypothetical protein
MKQQIVSWPSEVGEYSAANRVSKEYIVTGPLVNGNAGGVARQVSFRYPQEFGESEWPYANDLQTAADLWTRRTGLKLVVFPCFPLPHNNVPQDYLVRFSPDVPEPKNCLVDVACEGLRPMQVLGYTPFIELSGKLLWSQPGQEASGSECDFITVAALCIGIALGLEVHDYPGEMMYRNYEGIKRESHISDGEVQAIRSMYGL